MGGAVLAAVGLLLYPQLEPSAQTTSPLSLRQVAVPAPPEALLASVVRDKAAAIELGKALFWDMRVGSDNRTACASCHFHAGTDDRVKNQLEPGLLSRLPDTQFDVGKLYSRQGTNYTLTAEDFPFGLFGAEAVNDRVSSQGVFLSDFVAAGLRGEADRCSTVADPVFHGQAALGRVNTRRVAHRNTPSVINAVYNFRNFWDGRAHNVFNGVDPFGLRNGEARVWKMEAGMMRPVPIAFPSSSLASQASGPPLSEFEMSCRNRTFTEVGRKLLNQKILDGQAIAEDDSVLSAYARDRPSYATLVRRAFRPEFWSSPGLISFTQLDAMVAKSMDLRPSTQPGRRPIRLEVTQMEANFALFFGLALQLYQSTLISDDTPFDRFVEGQSSAMTVEQVRGMGIFNRACAFCHGGPEFTNASFSLAGLRRIGTMPMSDRGTALYDVGFYNIGVRPSDEDPGVGGVDPWGRPLSETLMQQQGLGALLGNGFATSTVVPPDARVAVRGAFKTPGLRNVELTGPYMHNGGKSTLMQVVDFYAKGGDFVSEDSRLRPLNLSVQDKQDLVAFMLALTDERVRFRRAPFDHPSICVPNGHPGDTRTVRSGSRPGEAEDSLRCLPAVGARGATTPLAPFLGLSPFAP